MPSRTGTLFIKTAVRAERPDSAVQPPPLFSSAGSLPRAGSSALRSSPLPPPVPPRRRAGGDDDDAPPLQPALSAAQGHPEAAKALRVAAGVYTYLETNLADLAAAGSRRSALDCVR